MILEFRSLLANLVFYFQTIWLFLCNFSFSSSLKWSRFFFIFKQFDHFHVILAFQSPSRDLVFYISIHQISFEQFHFFIFRSIWSPSSDHVFYILVHLIFSEWSYFFYISIHSISIERSLFLYCNPSDLLQTISFYDLIHSISSRQNMCLFVFTLVRHFFCLIYGIFLF